MAKELNDSLDNLFNGDTASSQRGEAKPRAPMRVTLAMVRKAAAAVGATVEDEKIGHCHECRVEAPHRKRWACRGVHEMVDSCYQPWKPDYADMLDGIKFGLEDCDDPDCEWCNGE